MNIVVMLLFTEMPMEPEVPTQPEASDFTLQARTGQTVAKWRVAIVRNEELRKERKKRMRRFKICKKRKKKVFGV